MIKESRRGQFITIEGIEGVGKSTLINHLQKYLHQKTIPLLVTREPGGTPIAEEIRQLILSPHLESLCQETELLLLFASRAQHLAKVIMPTLQQGLWILSDRFTDASYAYQGGGRGIEFAQIERLEQWVQNDFQPDLTILLHAPVELALKRAKNRSAPDRIEAEDAQFFTRAQDVYLQRAKQFPKRFRLLDASQPLAIVQQQLENIIDEFLVAIDWRYE